jgi:hypothetical protein
LAHDEGEGALGRAQGERLYHHRYGGFARNLFFAFGVLED